MKKLKIIPKLKLTALYKRYRTFLAFIIMACLTVGYHSSALAQKTINKSKGRSTAFTSDRPSRITVADDNSYAPFSFIDSHGLPAGITVDIWKLWSDKTGIAVDFTLLDWKAALEAVRDGKADAIGGLFHTSERDLFFDFSRPFFSVETTIFFHRQIHGIRGLSDLQGFTIGVVKGDSAEELIQQKYPTVLLTTFSGTGDLVQAALAGKIKVFVADTEVGCFYLAKFDLANDFRQVVTPIAVNRQHTAVSKGNAALLSIVQQGFDKIDEKEIHAIVRKWTGRSLFSSIPWMVIGFAGAGIALIVGLVIIWNVMLKRKIADAMMAVELRNRQLRDSEARFKALFDLVPFSCVVTDLKGCYLMVNQTFCNVNNLLEQDVIGHTLAELGFSLEMQDTKDVMEELARSGKVTNREVTVISPYRNTHILLYSSRVIELEGQQVVLSATVDITQLRQAEQGMRANEYRFRTFFNSNPEGIALIDFDGNILDINKTFTKMSGYEAVVLEGRHFTELVPEVHHQKALNSFETIKAGLSLETFLEMSLICRDGSQLPISIKGWRVTDEKSAPVMIGVFVRDISEIKHAIAEKETLQMQLIQSQKQEAIGTLAGGIAHDFNNILGGMIGYTELVLMHETPTPDNKKVSHLHRVLEAGNRAKELVQQILRFSRKEATVMGVVAMPPLIKESIKLLRATLPATIRIDQRIMANPNTICGDPTQIHQVLMNLCTNAYHSMRETGGVLSISLENVILESVRKALTLEVPPGEYLKLIIQDTGCGIAPEVLNRVFEPYFTTKKVNEGTGLGLSVTLGIVRNHNGLIEVQSRIGEGTRFDIYLPLHGQTATEKTAPAGDLPRGDGQRLLVVDDEFFFLDVIRQNLEYLGYQVTACQSSLKALETYKQNSGKVDLMITDQTMPEMTGVQLIAEIRKTGADIPILLCTGYSETVTEQSARHYGINRFLMKPVTINDLAWAVHESFL